MIVSPWVKYAGTEKIDVYAGLSKTFNPKTEVKKKANVAVMD